MAYVCQKKKAHDFKGSKQRSGGLHSSSLLAAASQRAGGGRIHVAPTVWTSRTWKCFLGQRGGLWGMMTTHSFVHFEGCLKVHWGAVGVLTPPVSTWFGVKFWRCDEGPAAMLAVGQEDFLSKSVSSDRTCLGASSFEVAGCWKNREASNIFSSSAFCKYLMYSQILVQVFLLAAKKEGDLFDLSLICGPASFWIAERTLFLHRQALAFGGSKEMAYGSRCGVWSRETF